MISLLPTDSFSKNTIGDKGAMAVAEAVKTANNIKELRYNYNVLDSSIYYIIIKYLLQETKCVIVTVDH